MPVIDWHKMVVQVLEKVKVNREMDRDTLVSVARTSLRTKLSPKMADVLTEVCVCVHYFQAHAFLLCSLNLIVLPHLTRW